MYALYFAFLSIMHLSDNGNAYAAKALPNAKQQLPNVPAKQCFLCSFFAK